MMILKKCTLFILLYQALFSVNVEFEKMWIFKKYFWLTYCKQKYIRSAKVERLIHYIYYYF